MQLIALQSGNCITENKKIWLSLIDSCAIFQKDTQRDTQVTAAHPVLSPPFLGVASYMCVGPEGYWDPQGPDFSNCTSPWVNLITQKVTSCSG